MAKALCRQPPEADGNVALSRPLLCCPLFPSAADGKGLCRPPRTAKGDGKVRFDKEVLCRLLRAADGKGAFAISSGRQRVQTAINALLLR